LPSKSALGVQSVTAAREHQEAHDVFGPRCIMREKGIRPE